MTSFLGRLVKAAIRLYTFKFRRKQASVSRNIKIKNRKYNCPDRFVYNVGIFNGVKVESICPKGYNGDKIILQFHGGSAVMDMSSLFYRKVAEKYADLTGLAVYSIDYEAGRDKVHPSLLYDCFNAYKGLLESGIKPENIAAVGDSMGANLMLATCLKARDEGLPLPCALVSICGFLDNTASGQSYFVNAHKDPMYALPFYMSKETYSVRLRRIPRQATAASAAGEDQRQHRAHRAATMETQASARQKILSVDTTGLCSLRAARMPDMAKAILLREMHTAIPSTEPVYSVASPVTTIRRQRAR